jgi:hypothetical protein
MDRYAWMKRGDETASVEDGAKQKGSKQNGECFQ